MAHTALPAAFYSLHTAVGYGALIKIKICFQWRNEHFKPSMLLFPVGNDAMNALRYWQRRNELLCNIGNGVMNSSAMLVTAL